MGESSISSHTTCTTSDGNHSDSRILPPDWCSLHSSLYLSKQESTATEESLISRKPVGLLGNSPENLVCENCSAHVTTVTRKRCNYLQFQFCVTICIVGLLLPFLWLGCCLIPFCIPGLYHTDHTCPNCRSELIFKYHETNNV